MNDVPRVEIPDSIETPGGLPGPDAPVEVAVRAAIADGVRRLLAAAPDVHQGDTEGVHQMRVATRRLRSDLQTFRSRIDPDWSKPLRDELRWLGGCLGDVRELDVLISRLRKATAVSDAEHLAPLMDRLAARHADARERLDAALDSHRFGDLKGRLIDACRNPGLAGDRRQPCRDALPVLVAATWKKLARRGRVLRLHDPDGQFHETRIRAKRLRYAAEAAAPLLDPEESQAATELATLASRLQDVLGAHQDATIAAQTVRTLAAELAAEAPPLTPEAEAALNRLARRQARAADKARQKFPALWKKIDRPKRLDWLQGPRIS